MEQEIVSVIEDALYARSPAYLQRLRELETMIDFSKGEQRIAYMEEYVDLIAQNGPRTELSHSITIALANSKECDILQPIPQYLDSGISQAEAADTPDWR